MMSSIAKMNTEQLQFLKKELESKYLAYQAKGLKLDMTRGKPAPAQLDLADGLLALPGKGQYQSDDGSDCRNYGGLDGLPAMKAFFGEILGAPAEQVIIGGNASLTLMYDALMRAYVFGRNGSDKPWKDEATIKFLCPSPGYDRHFAITEELGFEMIAVPINDDGPDMDKVESLAAADAAIKGIWCVPKYANPTGSVYSDEVVGRLAKMPTAANDFCIMWDNAYAEHPLVEKPAQIKNILEACSAVGNPDRALVFGSTSKISFAGAGVSALASSPGNIAAIKAHLGIQTIGPDKLNQLRHLKFFGDVTGLRNHMQKHAAILKPKFAAVEATLNRELADTGCANWSKPEGGYFVSLDAVPGCAKKIITLAADAGVKMTAAGAAFPYQKDPNDSNIRIAPSFPSLADVELAIEILACCIQLAVVQKFLDEK